MAWDFHKKSLLVFGFIIFMGLVAFACDIVLQQFFAVPSEVRAELIDGVMEAQVANCASDALIYSEGVSAHVQKVLAEAQRNIPYAWAYSILSVLIGITLTYATAMLLVSKLAKTVVIIGGKAIELKS